MPTKILITISGLILLFQFINCTTSENQEKETTDTIKSIKITEVDSTNYIDSLAISVELDTSVLKAPKLDKDTFLTYDVDPKI